MAGPPLRLLLLLLLLLLGVLRPAVAIIVTASVFPHMDANGDTLVTRDELQMFLERRAHVFADFYVADRDRNEKVTLEELQAFVPGASETYYTTFLDEFDDSGDGAITLEEWRNHHGYPRAAKDLVWLADTNEDGFVTEKEFDRLVSRPEGFPEEHKAMFDSDASPGNRNTAIDEL